MDERRDRLDKAIKRRDAAKQEVQRIQGRLDSARAEQQRVEKEIRDKKLDPEKLDVAIQQLEERYEAAVTDLESKVVQAEQDLAPFRTKE